MSLAQQIVPRRVLSHSPHRIVLRKCAFPILPFRRSVSNVGDPKGSIRTSWTKEEVARLKELRANGNSWNEVAAALPGRTAAGCYMRYAKCPGRTSGRLSWTKEQLAQVLKLRNEGNTWTAIAAENPGRTPAAVKAAYIRITGPTKKTPWWTAEETTLLNSMRLHEEPWRKIREAFPDRTMPALFAKVAQISDLPRKAQRWTEEENGRLLELRASGQSWMEIKSAIPGRSLSAIQRHHRLICPRSKDGRLIIAKHPVFTAEERDAIHRLHGEGKSCEEIHAAACPDKSFSDMLAFIKTGRCGDELDNTSRFREPWTRLEDKTILNLRQKEHKSFKEIAQVIGRSRLSTSGRYYRLTEGTVRPAIPMRTQYTAAERAKIAQMVNLKTPVKEIAAAIGRSQMAVLHHLFIHRRTLGYLQVGPSWQERMMAAEKSIKLRNDGLSWKEIQEQIPQYTARQLRSYCQAFLRDHVGPVQEHPSVTESELQKIWSRIRSMRSRGLDWSEIGLRFPQHPPERIRSLYMEADMAAEEREGDQETIS